MSEQPVGPAWLEWDLADRMKKALRVSGVSVQDMADYLDVTRGTVSTWINGRIKPSKQTLRLWAMRCGVPFEWLEEGAAPSAPDDGGPAVSRCRRTQVVSFPSLSVKRSPERLLLRAS